MIEFNLSAPSTSNVLMNGEAGAVFTVMVACLALKAIMKDQVEQNRSRSRGNGHRRRSREEPGKYEIVCKDV